MINHHLVVFIQHDPGENTKLELIQTKMEHKQKKEKKKGGNYDPPNTGVAIPEQPNNGGGNR
jgi:hypothetical protein